MKRWFCRFFGHRWAFLGGRSCPKRHRDDCSQPVYQCARCGEYDYGYPGGPGWQYCQSFCIRWCRNE